MPDDLEDAWSVLHDAKPPGWFVGRPSYDEGQHVWEQYAFDPQERAQAVDRRGPGSGVPQWFLVGPRWGRSPLACNDPPCPSSRLPTGASPEDAEMDSGVVVVITTSLAIILVAFVIPIGFLLWRQRTRPDEQRRTLRRAVGLLLTAILLIALIAIWTYMSA